MKRSNITTIVCIGACILLFSSTLRAERVLKEITWSQVEQDGSAVSGEVHPARGGEPEFLRITGRDGGRCSSCIYVFHRPGVTKTTYAVTGMVRCRDVEAEGYLEMWSCFPGGGRFFSRTAEAKGPMRKLTGTQSWRRFVLPFCMRGDGSGGPSELEVNVVLPGRGTVDVGPLSLVEYESGEDPLAETGAWWSDRMAGLIGGFGGSLIGLWGGLIGILCGMGKGRGFVLASIRVVMYLGLGMLTAGVVAVICSQPYGVWYPLCLAGVICAVVPLGIGRAIRRRYQDDELRKMEVMDVK